MSSSLPSALSPTSLSRSSSLSAPAVIIDFGSPSGQFVALVFVLLVLYVLGALVKPPPPPAPAPAPLSKSVRAIIRQHTQTDLVDNTFRPIKSLTKVNSSSIADWTVTRWSFVRDGNDDLGRLNAGLEQGDKIRLDDRVFSEDWGFFLPFRQQQTRREDFGGSGDVDRETEIDKSTEVELNTPAERLVARYADPFYHAQFRASTTGTGKRDFLCLYRLAHPDMEASEEKTFAIESKVLGALKGALKIIWSAAADRGFDIVVRNPRDRDRAKTSFERFRFRRDQHMPQAEREEVEDRAKHVLTQIINEFHGGPVKRIVVQDRRAYMVFRLDGAGRISVCPPITNNGPLERDPPSDALRDKLVSKPLGLWVALMLDRQRVRGGTPQVANAVPPLPVVGNQDGLNGAPQRRAPAPPFQPNIGSATLRPRNHDGRAATRRVAVGNHLRTWPRDAKARVQNVKDDTSYSITVQDVCDDDSGDHSGDSSIDTVVLEMDPQGGPVPVSWPIPAPDTLQLWIDTTPLSSDVDHTPAAARFGLAALAARGAKSAELSLCSLTVKSTTGPVPVHIRQTRTATEDGASHRLIVGPYLSSGRVWDVYSAQLLCQDSRSVLECADVVVKVWSSSRNYVRPWNLDKVDQAEYNKVHENEVRLVSTLELSQGPGGIIPRYFGSYEGRLTSRPDELGMQVVYDVRMVILENVGHEIPLHELQSRRQDILEAYRVLHQANVVHCDVERRHWRISHGQIKIIDFSESKTLSRCSSIEAGRMCAEEMDMVNDLLGGQG